MSELKTTGEETADIALSFHDSLRTKKRISEWDFSQGKKQLHSPHFEAKNAVFFGKTHIKRY